MYETNSVVKQTRFSEYIEGYGFVTVDVSHWEHPESWPESSARTWWLTEMRERYGISGGMYRGPILSMWPLIREYQSSGE